MTPDGECCPVCGGDAIRDSDGGLWCIAGGTISHVTPAQSPGGPDYRLMNGPDLLAALGDDGQKWAMAFLQFFPLGRNWHTNAPIDEATMVGWFANAIENSHDVRMRRAQPTTKPTVDEKTFPRRAMR